MPIQFRAWLPDGFEKIKGLIISLPGTRGDQQGITGNSQWQFRLSQMGYGIVGFRDGDFGSDYWGSGLDEGNANLQLVLDSIANSFGHPEIKNAPILIDGVSKGGFAVGHLASLVPERTLGFIADKGYSYGALDDQIYSAPGVAIAGRYDSVVPATGLQQAFTIGRLFDLNLAFVVEWRTSHVETTENLRLAIMDQMIRARYPHVHLPSLAPNEPLTLNEPTGWLGEAPQIDDQGALVYNPLPIIAPESAYPLDPLKASWFANATLATIFQSHNDDTFSTKPLQMSVISPINGKIRMRFSVNGIVSHRLELYHEEELIGIFDPSAGPIQFTYEARQNGLHTFIGKAEYVSNGETKYTTNYLASVVQGVVIVPEPVGITLFILSGIVWAFLGRFGRGIASSNPSII